jgi:outer membrane protein OmpA-like peptidoglycan-associated protein
MKRRPSVVGVVVAGGLGLGGTVAAQEAPLEEQVANLRAELETTLAAVEERRMELAGRAADPGAEDALGRLVTEVIFPPGDVTIEAGARQRLAGVAEAMRRLGASRVRIVGYSDRTGPADINTELARNRAEVVGELFVEAGFPNARVEIISALDSGLPLPIPTPDGVAEPRNRAARIFAAG